MEFKARKITVDPSDPYKNDCLSRRGDVDNLSLLLRNIASPIVLSVNAPWGQGKTTFLEMLHADLKSKSCKSVFFSAWETDFASDPLLAFLGEMNEVMSGFASEGSAKSEAWKTAKKAGVHILKKGIPALVKIGTAGIVDIDKVVEGEVTKITEGLSKDLIDQYTKDKSEINAFKDNLKTVLKTSDNSFEKLYIFVDELDRCRPTYAIELLERIKHLLDIEGLVFVLAMDKEQLSHSVKAIYGNDFDSIGYLKRFIDIEYSLPRVELDDFIDKLYKSFGFDQFFENRKKYSELQYDYKHLKDVFKLIAKAKKYSLRDVEQFITRINLVILSTGESTYLHPALLTFLLMVKDSNSELYIDFIDSNSTPERMIEYLYALIPPEERLDSNECKLIEGLLISAKMGRYSGNKRLGQSLEYHQQNIKDENCNEVQKYYSNDVINIAEKPGGAGHAVSLGDLVSRIELSEKFQFSKSSK